MFFRAAIPCLLGSILSAFGAATPAHARIGLVVGEPFGSFGSMLPVGHAGIYLDRLCADTPTRLRYCHPGESGVVLSRYHDLKTTRTDWMAIPAFTFFYGVDSSDQLPTFITPPIRDQLRENYREEHLRKLVPAPIPIRIDRDGKTRLLRNDDWQEAIGAAFDRRLFVYSLATTPAQDAALLAYVNNLNNHRRYTLGRSNCADFAADLLRLVLPTQPGILHRTLFADFDITTPKTLARQLDAYGRAHPELDLAVHEIPQLPGTLRRSRPLRGSAELFLTTKRYLFTLTVIQPEFVLADAIAYAAKGRWKPGTDALRITPGVWPGPLSTTETTPQTPAPTTQASQ